MKRSNLLFAPDSAPGSGMPVLPNPVIPTAAPLSTESLVAALKTELSAPAEPPPVVAPPAPSETGQTPSPVAAPGTDPAPLSPEAPEDLPQG